MRYYLLLLGSLLFGACQPKTTSGPREPMDRPNIILIFADDLGYGDLGVYGHPTIRTHHLDQMAREGAKLTQFYVAASVCSPSRGALLTGRLPVRTGIYGNRLRVFFPPSSRGIPESEITLAEGLKSADYATAIFGKWHLGKQPPFLPLQHGFDEFFGLPYSNDMSPRLAKWEAAQAYPPLPLMEGNETLETEPDQTQLTRRYTERAVQFIKEHQQEPFFLYLPHSFPHVPLFASEDFLGKSKRGLYGDVVEELDWSVGRILAAVDSLQLAENTLILFTSDNGPWLVMKNDGGSAGLLREGKGCTWEGGMREPFLARWSGTIPEGLTADALATTMDLLPTCFALAGVDLPEGRVLDGRDMFPVLKGERETHQETIYYYHKGDLFAIRHGAWKLHFQTLTPYVGEAPEVHDPPLLFHLEHDPGEQRDLAQQEPEKVAELIALAEAHQASFSVLPAEMDSLDFAWP